MRATPRQNQATRSLMSSLPLGLWLFTALALSASCGKDKTTVRPPLDGSGARNQIEVISDLHLGADLAYAEINQNRTPLVLFLDQTRESSTIKELVIAGDLLDEWFVPATTDTYAGANQADFVRRIALANREVIDAFNRIIREGKIRVTYVPGNHDLNITAENVESILPGIHQARDDVQGLGTYSPQDHPEIAIEHGHRYNFFCAPDPISNSGIAPGAIMPAGYFFTRIATLHVVQHCTTAGDTIPEVTPNPEGGESQSLAYVYWNIWKSMLHDLPITNKFDEKIIRTNISGFTESYAVADVLPFQHTRGGLIDMNLFKSSLDTWDQRQTLNHVAVHIPTMTALTEAVSSSGTDIQATTQYFANPQSGVRIVVFGHTHDAKILAEENHAGLKCVYANTGTWIDHNKDRTSRNVVEITPQGDDASLTKVRLYNFEGEVMNEMAADSLRL
jgi:UDP-2,3-diacylglucosamine pyrophosphatase LpxH